MEALFLRHHDGTAIGPLTREALEVLWDARIVGPETPVSLDGRTFQPVQEHRDLMTHLEEVKVAAELGETAWPESISVTPARPTSVAQSAGTTLSLLIGHAVERSQGVLHLPGEGGRVRLSYRDGKIVSVDAEDPSLSLEAWLSSQNLITHDQIEEARVRAESMGHDLGAALVSGGVLAPVMYFEQLVAWATATVGRCLLRTFARPRFVPSEVPAPSIPLGFDRFGVLFEALRQTADRTLLESRLFPHRTCPLIPSQVEGLSLEETKPKPRELRTLNAINGALCLDNLLEQFGGGEAARRDVLRAVLFATEARLVVFGTDGTLARERTDAQRLEQDLADMTAKNLFDLLGIDQNSSDEEVRQRYTDLAKKYHPDGLRPNCAPELLEVRQRLFSTVQEAFEATATTEQRYQYALDLEAGRVGSRGDQAKVEAALEAETFYKKAEILLRMKKYSEAVEHIDEAIKRTPDDIEFQIFRVYATYRRTLRRGDDGEAATNAIKQIQKLLKSNPDLASGYLYLGYLNKAISKPQVAVRYFKKVLEYDDIHPEASREVRLANARKEREGKKRRWGL